MQPTASRRWGARLGLGIGICAVFVLMFPTACYWFETPTHRYETAAAMQVTPEGGFARGSYLATDFPAFRFPASARDLRLASNIDTNSWWLRFDFASTDSVQLVGHLAALSPAEAAGVSVDRPFWLRWWSPDLAAGALYVSPGERTAGCLVVNWQAARAYAWQCRARAA
jgi:hypothetical protein